MRLKYAISSKTIWVDGFNLIIIVVISHIFKLRNPTDYKTHVRLFIKFAV